MGERLNVCRAWLLWQRWRARRSWDRLWRRTNPDKPLGAQVGSQASYNQFIKERASAIVSPEPVSRQEGREALARTINIGTREQLYDLNMANYRANAPLLKKSRGIGAFIGRWEDTPIYLVGAGPSLGKNGSQLRRVADAGWPILAVDAALPILDRLGVEPDLAFIIDTKASQKLFFEGLKPEKTILLAVSCAHPEALAAWPREIRFFNSWGNPDDEYIHLRYGRDFGSIGIGGNVSTAMLSFAVTFCGASPIVLVGHDFAFKTLEGYYPEGGVKERIPVGKTIKPTWDIYGKTVFTDLSLASYRNYTEDFIKDAQRIDRFSGRRTRFVNATEGGILGVMERPGPLMEEIEFSTLADVIDELEQERSAAAVGSEASSTPELRSGAIAAAV